MRGRRSSDSAGAVSRSRGEVIEVVEGVEVIEGASESPSLDFLNLDILDDLDDLDTLAVRAESTSAICRCRASLAVCEGASRSPARCTRTAAPRSATAEKN